MTSAAKITNVKTLCDNDSEATDALVTVYLNKAESAILRRMYPTGYTDTAYVPREYEMLQCELATRYFFRRGGEGEVGHTENGVTRSYKDTNDEDLLSEVVQVVTLK